MDRENLQTKRLKDNDWSVHRYLYIYIYIYLPSDVIKDHSGITFNLKKNYKSLPVIFCLGHLSDQHIIIDIIFVMLKPMNFML